MTEEEKILRKAFNEQNLRIYEYLDDEGRIFWSFSKTEKRVHVYRLRLVDRIGLNFLRYVHELKHLIRSVVKLQDDKKLNQAQIIQDINWGGKGSVRIQPKKENKK
tara:strand:- start:4 stop:321 length:318 start_codon:yes stop_codon:yes gene_type:complete